MNLDLNTPQRQSTKGLLVLFAYSLVQIFKSLWTVLLIILLRSREFLNFYYIGGFTLLTLVLALIFSFLNYYFFTFYIDRENRQFVLEKGWLNRTKTVIKFEKIQQVNLNQKLIHQIINVYEVNIDTAGSSGNEVKIPAVSGEVAQKIQKELLNEKEQTEKEEHIPLENTLVKEPVKKRIVVSLQNLFYIGITRNYIQSVLVLVALAFQLFSQFNQFISDDDEDYENLSRNYNEFSDYVISLFQGTMIPFVIFLLFVLAITVNLIRTLIRFFQYQIELKNQSFLVRYGLFEKHQTTVQNSRIQWLKMTQNYLQKKLNILEIKAYQAGGSVSENNEKQISNITVPGVSKNEKQVLINHIYPTPITYHEIIRPKKIKFIIRVFWFSMVPSAILLGYILLNELFYYFPFAIILALLTSVYQYRVFKNAVLYWGKDYIIIKKGFWDIDIQVLPIQKIQKVNKYQYFWQKNSNMAHISLATASSALSFSYADDKKINDLVNYCLYEVESKNLNWM